MQSPSEEPAPAVSTWTSIGSWLLLIVVPLLAYGISLGGDFVLDDGPDILRHPVVQGSAPVWDVGRFNYMGNPLGDGPNTWRPWPTLTYWLQWTIFGNTPWLFRLWNLLLHCGTVLLAARVLPAYMPRRAAYLGALFFSGLAIHSSVLASAAHSPDIWLLLFSLVALWATDKQKPVLATLAVLLACFSKESGLLLPLLLFAAAWVNKRSYQVPSVTLAAAVLWLIGRALLLPLDPSAQILPADNPLMVAELPTRVFMLFAVLGAYLYKTLVPVDLAYDYTYNAVPVAADFGNVYFWIGVAVSLFVVWLGARLRKEPELAKPVLLGVTGFVATYGVISNAVPIVVILAERLFYGPSFWLMAGLGFAADHLAKRRKGLAALLGVVLLLTQIPLAAVATYNWRSNLAMGIAQTYSEPDSAKAQLTLSQELSQRGQHDMALWHAAIASSGVQAFPDPHWRAPREAHYGDMVALAKMLKPDLPPGQVLQGFRGVVESLLQPATLAHFDQKVKGLPPSVLWPVPPEANPAP